MSSSSFNGSSPWSILGVKANASSQDVRDAYRKLALRWHPDQNNGCLIALEKFQRIKEAFEEIEHRRRSGYSPSNFYRNTNTASRASPSSKPSYQYRRPSSTNFYDFRRDADPSKSWSWSSQNRRRTENMKYSSPFEYARATQQNSNNSTSQSDWWRQYYSPRSRYAPMIGIGVAGIFVISFFGILALGSDVLWRANNKGKSFEELMKSLDQKHEEKLKQKQRQKREKPGSVPST